MNRIFETAAEIGCLGPYLNTLAARRGQSDSAREQWQINRRLDRSIP